MFGNKLVVQPTIIKLDITPWYTHAVNIESPAVDRLCRSIKRKRFDRVFVAPIGYPAPWARMVATFAERQRKEATFWERLKNATLGADKVTMEEFIQNPGMQPKEFIQDIDESAERKPTAIPY